MASDQVSVWLIDDESTVRIIGQRVLQRDGLRIVGLSSSPVELLAHLDAGGERPGVVVSDVRLADGDVGDLAKALRPLGIPLLLVTGCQSQALVRSAARAGIRGVVGKPFTQAGHAAAVRAVAAGFSVFESVPIADRPSEEDADLVKGLADALQAADDHALMLGRLAGTTAHDLNAGLAAVGGHLDLHVSGLPPDLQDGTGPDIDTMRQALASSGSKVRRLRTMSQGADPHWSGKRCDLVRAVDEGIEHHFGLPVIVRVNRSRWPYIPVLMDGHRLANIVWAAVRAVAAAGHGRQIEAEVRSFPEGVPGAVSPMLGRIRISTRLASGDQPDGVPPYPDWEPPHTRSQLQPDDLVEVLGGRRGNRVVADLWLPVFPSRLKETEWVRGWKGEREEDDETDPFADMDPVPVKVDPGARPQTSPDDLTPTSTDGDEAVSLLAHIGWRTAHDVKRDSVQLREVVREIRQAEVGTSREIIPALAHIASAADGLLATAQQLERVLLSRHAMSEICVDIVPFVHELPLLHGDLRFNIGAERLPETLHVAIHRDRARTLVFGLVRELTKRADPDTEVMMSGRSICAAAGQDAEFRAVRLSVAAQIRGDAGPLLARALERALGISGEPVEIIATPLGRLTRVDLWMPAGDCDTGDRT